MLTGMFLMSACMTAYAKESNADSAEALSGNYKLSDVTICEGVYAQDIDLSGMTALEAENAIQGYVSSLAGEEIVLQAGEDYTVTVTAGDFGISWGNPEILNDALRFGQKGNIVKRYKEMADLARENQIYDIVLDFDKQKIEELLMTESEMINVPAENPTMYKEGEEFVIEPGKDGREVDLAASVDLIYEYLTGEWKTKAQAIELATAVVEPAGTVEDLEQIQDVLATFTTSFSTSDASRSANVRNASNKVNGTLLFPGEEFSTLATIAPFTTQNGYYPAGSYVAGKVVDSVGGGICQVSSTLYNAVLQAELEVTDRSNHAMAVGYVKVGLDATVSEDSGIDFKFRNNTEYPIYIESYTTQKKNITISIYGVDTRAEGHDVTYYSHITSSTPPGPEIIYADPSQPLGFIEVQPSHTGYVADVYKIVTEDGVEVSREQITHSVYKMTCRSVTVGTATSDPVAYSTLEAAIASGSVDHVKAVVYQLLTPPAPEGTQEPIVDADAGVAGMEGLPGADGMNMQLPPQNLPGVEVQLPVEGQPGAQAQTGVVETPPTAQVLPPGTEQVGME